MEKEIVIVAAKRIAVGTHGGSLKDFTPTDLGVFATKAALEQSTLDPKQIDIGEVIEWVAAQPWCDGRLATSGTSYTADTTFMSFITSPPALKVGVSRAVDFDAYRQLMAPGGIDKSWMAKVWGEMTGAQDQNAG